MHILRQLRQAITYEKIKLDISLSLEKSEIHFFFEAGELFELNIRSLSIDK